MIDYNFEQIKEIILDWNKVIKAKYSEIVEEEKDLKNTLLLDFNFENCLAQIVVNKPTFAPYKYVSCEALDLKGPIQAEPIYFYYDSEYSTVKETIGMLDYGIQYCLDYIPDKLAKLYIGKRGILNFEKNELTVIYPDDINIVFNKNEEFECIGVQYQYIVVSNKKFSVRVLPEIFTVIA